MTARLVEYTVLALIVILGVLALFWAPGRGGGP